MATRLLVLANKTADSPELLGELERRAMEEDIFVRLVVPTTWDMDDPKGGRKSAHRRMRAAMEHLHERGIEVRGTLGDADPLSALLREWDSEPYDEIVISTLPERLSRWLRRDLPRRAEKLTGGPVTHIETRGGQTAPSTPTAVA